MATPPWMHGEVRRLCRSIVDSDEDAAYHVPYTRAHEEKDVEALGQLALLVTVRNLGCPHS